MTVNSAAIPTKITVRFGQKMVDTDIGLYKRSMGKITRQEWKGSHNYYIRIVLINQT